MGISISLFLHVDELCCERRTGGAPALGDCPVPCNVVLEPGRAKVRGEDQADRPIPDEDR